MKAALAYIRSKNVTPILILFYAVGIGGMIIPFSREFFKQLTPFILLMSTSLLLIFSENQDRKFWIAALSVFLIGFFAEVIGVKTGLLFGDYTYGNTLGPKLFNTPLMIGVNWLMLVYCTLVIAGKFVENQYFRAVVAAATMVVYDFVLEPAAIYFEMWSWEGVAVPLQNYIAWFILAFILSFLAMRIGLVRKNNKLASPLFFIQALFFIVLDLWIYAEKIWG